MRLLFVASEAFPLVKTGGLADVAGALPPALAECGVDLRLMMPAYPQALDGAQRKGKAIVLGDLLGVGEVRLVPARMPGSGVPLWLVDCPALFGDDGHPYMGPDGHDRPDNAVRFALLSRAAAFAAIAGDVIGWRPRVVHANDWQCGLIPAYLRQWAGPHAASVMTIHNVQYQGVFDPAVIPKVALRPDVFSVYGAEFYGGLSYLKAGLQYADRLTTVSPTYAREIQSPAFGFGMHGVLAARTRDLSGILNGVDLETWNPATDKLLPARYSVADRRGKQVCRKGLMARFGITDEGPIFGVVSRLADQKGLDLLLGALDDLIAAGGNLVLIGSGDPALEAGFRLAAKAHPGRIGVHIGYDEPLAHLLIAGSDALVVPSRFEPCGLTQLYALGYGTVPVVRRTGGLADTVTDAAQADQGTGVVFDLADRDSLAAALRRAIGLYRDRDLWNTLTDRGMAQDFSWQRAARAYADLYSSIA